MSGEGERNLPFAVHVLPLTSHSTAIQQGVRASMPRIRLRMAGVVASLIACGTLDCRSRDHGTRASGDSGFAQMQTRGKVAMGVDQYTSAHQFDDLPDGGRIELQRDPNDTAGVRTIREHLQKIAAAFSRGDFTVPGFVHADSVPGTATMRAKRSTINYRYAPLPGGGEVRITTRDTTAAAAVHDFLAYQRDEHHVRGDSESMHMSR